MCSLYFTYFPDRELILEPLAFDPLFWFHHAQVDRIIALWDVLHDKWVPGTDADERKPLCRRIYISA